MDRIDAHRHLFRGESHADVIGEMDKHGISRAVLMPLPAGLEFLDREPAGNEEVFALAVEHPDRLSAAVYVDPREPSAIETLRRLADRGAVCVKLWPPIGYFPDRQEFYGLYEEIERLHLPVMIHTGFTDLPVRGGPRAAANSRLAMPLELDGLIRAFGGINWIYAHAGNPDFATAIHHAAAHGNVYLNINGMAGDGAWDARLFAFHERMQGACAPLSWDKLIWGSDNIGFDFAGFDRIFQSAGQGTNLPAFYAGNARRLYRL